MEVNENIARVRAELQERPRRWLVTGAAGFIGSHLCEALLALDQEVLGFDDLSAGSPDNLAAATAAVTRAQAARLHFLQGDIRDLAACREAVAKSEIVLHHAALGSVPKSIEDPARWNAVNVDGFVNMLVAARDAGVRRFVYASSSSVYGDDERLPRTESRIGEPLSPYAASKLANEHYAKVFGRCYGMQTIGLRYFNVFGPRQDPAGPYAAVIPQWISALVEGRTLTIHGDGSTSRDFCYVANAVQANLLAAATPLQEACNRVFNVAFGKRTSLLELHEALVAIAQRHVPRFRAAGLRYAPFRKGDVLHSLADLANVRRLLGYAPTHDLRDGLEPTFEWFTAGSGQQSRPKSGAS
jgi:UDP-N-acetylglucosamine/UDP-N-acetylgalactosamine 4-epimerase